jgi:hypothetical protein
MANLIKERSTAETDARDEMLSHWRARLIRVSGAHLNVVPQHGIIRAVLGVPGGLPRLGPSCRIDLQGNMFADMICVDGKVIRQAYTGYDVDKFNALFSHMAHVAKFDQAEADALKAEMQKWVGLDERVADLQREALAAGADLDD